jgi:hypothetical protein
MTIFDDLAAEQDRLEVILLGLAEAQWLTESGAAGWSVADVMLHLAQTEEAVVTTVGAGAVASAGADPGSTIATFPGSDNTVDDFADQMVRAERDLPERVFARWQKARRAALDALRGADPQRPLRAAVRAEHDRPAASRRAVRGHLAGRRSDPARTAPPPSACCAATPPDAAHYQPSSRLGRHDLAQRPVDMAHGHL